MSEIMTVVEGRIEVFGKTVTERKMNVVRMAGASACTALLASGGRVGKVAAERIAQGGFVSLADQASRGNYRQVAEYFAAELGAPIIISKRADFEALPSRMEELVEKAKLAKNGGFRTDKKTGVEVPGAALLRAIRLHGVACDLVAGAAAAVAERMTQAMLTSQTEQVE